MGPIETVGQERSVNARKGCGPLTDSFIARASQRYGEDTSVFLKTVHSEQPR